ncbi:Uncharacterised protein [uncultured archaeon]|nr:Uncharacterised protein [uncultured archaeon]
MANANMFFMLEIQVIPQITKKFFRVVIFLKDHGIDADADISATFILPHNKEIIFLPTPDKKINYVYPESTSRFIHRIERGIYMIQSKNKAIFLAKKIIVNAKYEGKVYKKDASIQ